MENTTKPDTTTGSGTTKPILESEKEPTAVEPKPARTEAGSSSITRAELLALLQTDLSDLRSQGFTVAILENGNGIVMAVSCPEHKIGFAEKHITIDGIPVVQA